MVTGVEAAGLALAIFPLVVNGFGCYLDGIRKIKEAKNYRGVLKRLIRNLEMEKITFENTCEFFLEGMVSAKEMEDLVIGVGWDRPEFQIILQGRLRANEAEAFAAAVAALTEYLQELVKDLGLDEDQKLLLQDKRLQRTQWEKLKLVLDQESYKESLEEIRRINADLERLTMQRTRAPLQKPIPQSHAAEKYNLIRNQAKSLHGVLKERFQAAPCRCNHSASLQLENRMDPDSLRFKVLFNFAYVPAVETTSPRRWRALEFQPVDVQENTSTSDPPEVEGGEKNIEEETICRSPEQSPPPKKGLRVVRVRLEEGFESIKESVRGAKKPRKAVSFNEPAQHSQKKNQEAPLPKVPDTLRRIKDLCIAIKEATALHTNCCIGILEDQPKGLWHHIWPPAASPLSRYDPEPVSLDALLFPGSIEEINRLELGVKIALAVMQLHATEWLSESWGTKDIFFLQKNKSRRAKSGEIVTISEPELAMPFVRRMLGSSQEPCSLQKTEQAPELMEYDKSLFALGIVLIELWFEKPLKDLRIDQNQSNGDDADFETAQQRIGYLFSHAGEDYGLAVSHCINGLKGRAVKGKPIKTFLDNEDFKNDVHENVICLLQRNLEVFSQAYEL
ncbi:hypothetical protein K440DRAFT_626275 [Wilcoxina mikolae CBS 423.85]|nr:hypothetical protein K440DRAFT_626275 [Wilcoxina mikolae CBS 423.85]